MSSTPPPVQPPQANTKARRFPCAQCGAQLEFKPGASRLKCPYCGFEQDIPSDTSGVIELDFVSWLNRDMPPSSVRQVLQCTSCAASFEIPANESAGACPFCGGHVVVPPNVSGQIPPGSVLPFQVDAKQGRELFRKWVGSRFWAPNDLGKLAMLQGGLTGVYIPYWTYDSQTTTQYQGMMGIDRIETYTTTDSDGNTQTDQRVVTDWYPAAGTVNVNFDDVLVLASQKLPPQHASAMKTWQLEALVTYRDEYLSGFQAARYDLGLGDGFEAAKQIMSPTIDQHICADIGGNHQQIHWKSTDYYATTFKHLLLPIWSGAYRYRGKTWAYLINGQTGEIRGEAPVSPWKVALAVILGLIVLVVLFYLFGQNKSH